MKLANLSMGSRMPHVHCHVLPQYADDDPFALIDVSAGSVRLEEAALAARVEAMRALIAPQARPPSNP